MKCPMCGCTTSGVKDSRPSDDKTMRRRECLRCKVRFTTYELAVDEYNAILEREAKVAQICRELKAVIDGLGE